MTIYLSAIVILCILGIYLYLRKSKKSPRRSFNTGSDTKVQKQNQSVILSEETSLQSDIKTGIKSVRSKIDQHLNDFEEDRYNNILNNVLYPRFDLSNQSTDYKIKVKQISDLVEIGITKKEFDIGYSYLVKRAQTLNHKLKEIAWVDALDFLYRYAEINAQLRGLDLIKDKISDPATYEKYKKNWKRDMEELLNGFN